MTETTTEILNKIYNSIILLDAHHLFVLILLIILIAVTISKSEKKNERLSRISQQQKIISELQNITSRQQELIKTLKDTNDYLFRQTEVLKEIQKQTRTETQEEKEEIKKKIEELNKMMKV